MCHGSQTAYRRTREKTASVLRISEQANCEYNRFETLSTAARALQRCSHCYAHWYLLHVPEREGVRAKRFSTLVQRRICDRCETTTRQITIR